MLFLRWVKFSNVSSTGLKLNLTWHTRLILSALVPPLLILGSALGIRLMLDSDFGDEVKAIKSYKDRGRKAFYFGRTQSSAALNTVSSVDEKHVQATKLYEDLRLIARDLEKLDKEVKSIYLEMLFEKQKELSKITHHSSPSSSPLKSSNITSHDSNNCDFIVNSKAFLGSLSNKISSSKN